MQKDAIAKAAKDAAQKALDAKKAKEAKSKSIDVPQSKDEKDFEKSFFKALANGDRSSLADISKDIHSDYAKKGQTVGTSADGGFLVPETFEATVVQKLHEMSTIRPAATVVQMTNSTHHIPTENAAPTVQYVAEEVAITESKATVGRSDLVAQSIKALAGFSSEVLEDAVSNPTFRDYVINSFVREIAKFENNEFITGSGAAGNIPGVESYTPGNTGAIAGANVAADDILETWYSLPVQYRASATWLMSDTDRKLVHQLKDGDSRYLWTDGGGFEANQPTLMGRPVIVSTDVTAGEVHLIDLSYYLIGDYKGLRVDTGTNADDFSKDRVSVRLVKRTGGLLTQTEGYASLTGVV